MKVLVVHNVYRTRGGEETHVAAQIRALDSVGISTIQLTRDSSLLEGMLARIKAGPSVFYSVNSMKDILRLLTHEGVDLVHIHNLYPLISPSILPIIRAKGIPVVMTLHNLRLLCPTGLMFRDGAFCDSCAKGSMLSVVKNNCFGDVSQSIVYGLAVGIHKRLNLYSRYVNHFIAPSKFLKDLIMTYTDISQDRISVVNNYVDFCPGVNPDGIADNGYGLYVGRLAKEKGLVTLLKSYALLGESRLRVAGDGPLMHDLKALVIRLGIQERVEFLGFQRGEDFKKTLQEAKFVILPSECNENMPYSALESMSCGKPLIASDIGGLKELVIHGENGFLFEPGNAENLAECIKRLEEEPNVTRNMGHNASLAAERTFSKKVYLRKLMCVYDGVLQSDSRFNDEL